MKFIIFNFYKTAYKKFLEGITLHDFWKIPLVCGYSGIS